MPPVFSTVIISHGSAFCNLNSGKEVLFLLVTAIRDMLWGLPTVFLIFSFGIYFSIKGRFLQLRAGHVLGETVFRRSSGSGGISPFSALSTALGGTVGIGSMVGVGLGIAYGGAGSVFWMWVCGIITSMIKYAEVYVAVDKRVSRGNEYAGGAMYCLADAGKRRTAVFFSVCCIVAALGVGNAVQSNTIGGALERMGVSLPVSGAVLAALLALVIFDGRSRIASVNSFLMPLFTALYIAVTLYVIVSEIEGFFPMLGSIFRGAFGFEAVAGGFSASLMTQALKVGVSKGIFSTEAGMGSSPIAHAAAADTTPHRQGLWGIIETSADTFVISTLTAFAMLLSGTDDIASVFIKGFGAAGGWMTIVFLSVFAFASIISWCFYADGCIAFLFPGRTAAFSVVFRLLSVAVAFGGVFLSSASVWAAADIFNALMIFPNLFMLFIYRKDIKYGAV